MGTTLERITINNILAFMIVGVYVGIWAFAIFSGITAEVNIAEGETHVQQLLNTLESMQGVIGTMTIIVVLVVQFFFRTAPSTPVVN
jgi:hypothetical protein